MAVSDSQQVIACGEATAPARERQMKVFFLLPEEKVDRAARFHQRARDG